MTFWNWWQDSGPRRDWLGSLGTDSPRNWLTGLGYETEAEEQDPWLAMTGQESWDDSYADQAGSLIYRLLNRQGPTRPRDLERQLSGWTQYFPAAREARDFDVYNRWEVPATTATPTGQVAPETQALWDILHGAPMREGDVRTAFQGRGAQQTGGSWGDWEAALNRARAALHVDPYEVWALKSRTA